jgi:hypothetical protein
MEATPKAARKKRLSPKAYMPLDPCLSGPLVAATWMATTAVANAQAAKYPAATTPALARGLRGTRSGRLFTVSLSGKSD